MKQKSKKNLNVPNLRFKEFEGEWVEATLGELVENVRGKISTSLLSVDKYISTENILQNFQGVIPATSIPNNTNVVAFRKDDILFSNIRPYLKKIWLANYNGGCSADVVVFRSNDTCEAKFLHHLIANDKFINYVMLGTKGTKMPRGDKQQISNYTTYLPSKSEQTKIATFLSLLDDRISTQRQIIEEMKSLKDATNNKLIYENKLLNQKMRLSDIGEVKNGYAFKSKSYEERGKYKVITIANVTGERNISALKCNNIIDLPKDIQPHQTLKLNDILISLTGNVGRVSLCNIDNALLNQRVGLFVPNNIMNTEYIFQSISNKRFEKMMIASGKGAAQMNINKSDIENYEIPYSSDKVQLLKISSLLRKLDQKIETEQKLLSAYQNQKKYVLSQLFI